MADAPLDTPAPGSDDDTHYRVLARKYRPTDFSTLVGQEAMVRTLRNALDAGRLAHAFMLTGVRGVGKTTTARIVAKALNCVGPDGTGGPTMDPCGVCGNCVAITEDRHVDVIEMDAASRTGINDIRELIEGVRYRPVAARYKVYIIDEVHMLSTAAFNGLLKTLEEPPPHVKFVFATTEIRKVPVTVLSRCQRFDLRRVPVELLSAHFARVAESEKVEIVPEALRLIAAAADGSVRDGLSLLDQAIAHGGGVVDAAQVRDMLGLADRGLVFELFDQTMRGDAPGALKTLGDMYDAGADPVVVLQDMLELAHWLTRLKVVPESAEGAPELERTRGRDMAGKLGMAHLTRAWQMLLKGLQETQHAHSPIRAAEMALIRLCYAADLPTPADAIKTLQDGGGAPPPRPSAPGPGNGGGTVASAASSRGAPSGTSSGGPVARLAVTNAVVARVELEGEAVAAAPKPQPRDFAEVVALFESKREARLALALSTDVHPVRCEPGRLEFRPTDRAPVDLAPKVAEALARWTGQRWLVSVSGEAGEPTLASRRAAAVDARRQRALEHPLVRAALAMFPGATLQEVRGPDDEPAPAAMPQPVRSDAAEAGEPPLFEPGELSYDDLDIPEGDL
ncbi:MAG: DNA polymerase III subunit gamma/tau [Alphaproteobacteria bacterium]|nr:DNA polymerase III subunit gamma/tau [Alphaproteobacteria bacterium]MCW5741736.1 DNA polymerase III subunit gamma/tau [Alphaproteobacteria bacterium]